MTDTAKADDMTPITPSDYAAGRAEIPPNAAPVSVRAAKKDYNARGSRREHWFRLVLRDGRWQYFADERLPSANFRAAERKATVYGDAYIGELLAEHDRGGPIDTIYLVVGAHDGPTVECEFRKRRDGQLSIDLPDGSEIVRPNPRR